MEKANSSAPSTRALSKAAEGEKMGSGNISKDWLLSESWWAAAFTPWRGGEAKCPQEELFLAQPQDLPSEAAAAALSCAWAWSSREAKERQIWGCCVVGEMQGRTMGHCPLWGRWRGEVWGTSSTQAGPPKLPLVLETQSSFCILLMFAKEITSPLFI